MSSEDFQGIVNACDNHGNYILFNTSSSQATRAWSRADTSGRLYCCANTVGTCVNGKEISEKRKYTVLRYENNNNEGPGHQRGSLGSNRMGSFSSGLVNRNFTRSLDNTIKIGNINYAVSARIKSIIVKYQEEGVIPGSMTADQLKKYIAIIRELIKEKADIGVRLRDVPLSQYKSRYVYNAGGNKWPTGSQVQPIYLAPKNFSVPYVLTDYALSKEVMAALLDTLYAVPDEAILNGTFSTGRAQYLQVIRNDTCGYTGSLEDIKPATSDAAALNSASVWGTRIISPNRFDINSLGTTGLANFVVMRPADAQRYGGKYQSRVGLIIVINGDILRAQRTNIVTRIQKICALSCQPASQAYCTVGADVSAVVDKLIDCVTRYTAHYSEFIFVPIETSIDKLANPQLPTNTNVTFPRALKNDLTPASVADFNHQITSLLSDETKYISRFNIKVPQIATNIRYLMEHHDQIPTHEHPIVCKEANWDAMVTWLDTCIGT